jgi:GT2 family glycosyltransferase/2-polyprenyl-3-methyl-5-hydroxy-6-metoxy-1,4-benzoquinol methylase
LNKKNQPYVSFLANHGLKCDDTSKVWRDKSDATFDYSDGDEVENRIACVIAEAQDVSLFSAELGAHQIDWPSIYHLSAVRANLLRPLAPLLSNRRVLEIGAGCGAISRYLGELNAEVLALEGSRRRAATAAGRCRDLSNVTVVNQTLEQFPDGEQFDVVTLIGVLEYARKYSAEPDGVAATLRRARSLLKEGGVLVIAIENQLGLKYFAGMHEDHLGRAMAGIQDHYSPDGVVTFGRQELSEKILAAGFTDCEFALPFPDYKLPSNVILPAGWNGSSDFDAATLAGQATRSDRQLTHPLLFSTSQAFAVAQRNGLLADISNSFLILARSTASAPGFGDAAPDVLACHYAAERRPCYATSTTIRRAGKSISVRRDYLIDPRAGHKSKLLSQALVEEPYAQGHLWSDELDRLLSCPGWTVQGVGAWLVAWLEALRAHAPEAVPANLQSLRHPLPGHLIDAVPRNLVRAPDDRWTFFDQEWTLHLPVQIGYLAFRALNVSLATVTCVSAPADPALLHVPTLFRACLREMGFIVTGSDILEYLDFDAAIHGEVRGQLARPQTLAEYDGYMLVPGPDVTALLHGRAPDLPDLASRFSAQGNELNAARLAVEALTTDLANAGMHVKVLEAKVGEESAAKDAAGSVLTATGKELDAARQSVEMLSTELANAGMHIKALESKVGEESANKDAAHSALVAAEEALSAKLQHVRSLEKHIDEHASENSRLQGQLRMYIDGPLAELEQVKNQVSEGNTRLLELTARLADVSSLLSASVATSASLQLQLTEEKEVVRRHNSDAQVLRGQLDTATLAVSEKDNEIHRLWSVIETHQRDSETREQQAQQLQQDIHAVRQSLGTQEPLLAELARIKASTSWRLTSPLRAAKVLWLRILRGSASRAGALARGAYRRVPMPAHRKIAIKSALFAKAPLLFSRTNAYRRWEADVATHAADTGYMPALAATTTTSQPAGHLASYVETPALYVADGVTEWHDYPEVKARIATETRAKRQRTSPKPLKVHDFTSADLPKTASRISLPESPAHPNVSIIIPAYNHAARTLECLASIAACHDADSPTFEVIVADDASTEASADCVALVPHVRFVRQDFNQGFLRNCNAATKHARGKAILFLNNDVQVTPGWLEKLWSCLQGDPSIGAVGPRIVYPSGWLQDAGTRLRRDGTGEMIGLNEMPDTPAYSYDRDVDYCSGACLLLRREDFDLAGGFDDRYAPAYCEDSDLCMQLRERGKRIVFCGGAEVVHHLSATSDSLPSDYKLSCITRNLDTFAEKWRHQLDDMDRVRTIAFYLPQFHPFPENDLWWGEGFTEWTNVTKARPNYVGHYQPRVPADLGYYDLRVPEVMEKQAELARRYGVGGFCFYYYWFAGKRLLERPIEQMLESGEPGFPFCLCWANENWTRRWDGQEHDVLMAQGHSDEDDLAVIEDLARYFRSESYIRVNGKPLLLVYRVTLFPDFARTSALWRRYCRENGLGEIYIAQVESFELVTAGIRPEDLGCDAAVEFPPQGMAEPRSPSGDLLNQNFAGAVADYHDLAVRYATRELPSYKRFMGVMPGWDNTARRQNNSYSFERASPGAFQAWLESAVKRTKQQYSGDERLIFINAWNEWAEGAYLEPDRRFGHSFLQAHLNALEAEYLVERKSAFPE